MSVILATAGYDHKIRFWEAPSGICSRIIKYPDSQVNRLQITPDKQFIAAAGNPHIRLYEILNSTQPSAVETGMGGVEPPTQQPVLTLEGHTAAVTSIGFQRDGRYLYSGSEDGTIKVWDLRNPNYSRSFDSKGGVNSVTLRTDRDEFISGDQNGYVKVWDLGGNGCIHSVKPSSAPLADDQDGNQLNNNHHHHQPQTQTQHQPPNPYNPQQYPQQQPPQYPQFPQQQPQHQHGREYFASEMAGSGAGTGAAGGQQQQRRRMVQRAYHEGTVPIQAVDISEDSRTIVACSNHGTVFVWSDEKTRNTTGSSEFGNNSSEHQHQQQLLHPSYHHHHPEYHHHHPGMHPPPPLPNNPLVSTSSSGSIPTTADLLSRPLHRRFRAHNDTTPGNYCLHGKMAPDGRHFVTTGSDGYALLWNTTTWECAQKLKNQKWVWDAAFCADSSYLVTASSDHIARLWNLRTGDVVRQYHGHQSAVTCVALNDSSV